MHLQEAGIRGIAESQTQGFQNGMWASPLAGPTQGQMPAPETLKFKYQNLELHAEFIDPLVSHGQQIKKYL